MDKKEKFSIILQEKIDSGLSIKEVSDWVSQVYSEYAITEEADIDIDLLDLMIELMELKDASDTEEAEERMHVIADQIADEVFPRDSSTVQFGWWIKEKIKEGFTPRELNREAASYISNYFPLCHTYENNDVYSISWYLEGVDVEMYYELTLVQFAVLGRLLILQKTDPINTMLKIVKDNFNKKKESPHTDLAKNYLNLLSDESTINKEEVFHLALKHSTLATFEWDSQGFTLLGLAYLNWGDQCSVDENYQKDCYYLSLDAFHASLQFDEKSQGFYHCGLASERLANLLKNFRYFESSVEGYYKRAISYFKNAMNLGISEASDHLHNVQHHYQQFKKK